jgi:hypothetical protein
MKVAGNMPWTTSGVADRSKSLSLSGESVKKLPIQGLMLQFPGDSLDIFRCHPIVAALNLSDSWFMIVEDPLEGDAMISRLLIVEVIDYSGLN